MQEVFKAKKATVIFTAVFSLFAHAFLFTNEFFSHDSLGYAYSFSREFVTYYAGQGRFGIPLYELVKGNGAAPWLIGILFMLWLSLSAIFVTDMFRISSTMGAVFTGGLLCTNAALTLTGATYIDCLDEYAFALFTVCAAVWTFGRGKWWPVIGIALIAVSLSIYQAYYTVAISLCLIAVINRVLSDEDGMLIFGTKYIAFLVLGFVLYYVVWTVVCTALGITKARVDESLLANPGQAFSLILDASKGYFTSLFARKGTFGSLLPSVNAALLLLLAWRTVVTLFGKTVCTFNKVILLPLLCLTPAVFNSQVILFPSSASGLTSYSTEFLYLLVLIYIEPNLRRGDSKVCRSVTIVLLCFVLWHNIVYANQVYLKKELDKNATISLTSRLIDRIELLDGYIPGETQVAVIGSLSANEYLNHGRSGFEDMRNTVGLWKDYSATYNIDLYLTEYLNYPIIIDYNTDFSTYQEVQNMPCFPAADSVKMIDGTAVIKLS